MPIPDEQARFERDVIFGMIKSLEPVGDAGYSNRQTTSFLSNPLIDDQYPTQMLGRLHDGVTLKLH